MYSLDPNTLSFLDKIRIDKGIDDLKNFFLQLSKKNLKKALDFINDKHLGFNILFILEEILQQNNLFNSLTEKNKVALLIVKEILTDKKYDLASEQVSFDYIQIIHSVLKWILETGFHDDGINDEYDQVLDITSILLTKVYRDTTLLPIMADMIFKRYQKGFFIHDLVWGFFECANPKSLNIIGERLLSSNVEDVKIASKLLNFIPGIDKVTTKERKYTIFLNWMKENSAFLKYTGESFHQTTNPKPYKIVLEGKYLCKSISPNTGKTLCSPSKKESNLLDQFKKLDSNTKVLLANFSFRIHYKNIYLWHIWREYSLEKQIKIARIGVLQ
ncbi:hypothetical protein [Clostridium kluyveri]|uniref:Uncharacterized protein n=2 Tax=Clostridium kluyveri TaxID=1534 RepID=A5N5L2_CLOK5|nr:hypothetical protein [Clostridium kluyveri]EDK32593.1 Conserved hypothetical protein [Clostridium kluyveri DSM 555]BAH05527.1 hypothetical protein CKR_0476 [Clostridium kluyveri NBRC 12016]